VIAAVDPRYGMALLTGHGWSGIAVLGGVFLAMTGGEAMYADMGHIGRNPIRTSWYGIVLPALLLNYAGKSRSTSAIRLWMEIRSSGWRHLGRSTRWWDLRLLPRSSLARRSSRDRSR
jgi:hypothetical protein